MRTPSFVLPLRTGKVTSGVTAVIHLRLRETRLNIPC